AEAAPAARHQRRAPREVEERGRAQGSRLAAEREPGAEVAAAARGRADRHVLRDAPQRVDHEPVDEAGEAAFVRPDLRPALGAAGGQPRVVDPHLGAVGVLAGDEVAGAGEARRRLVVVAPELAGGARGRAGRAAEALLGEREGGGGGAAGGAGGGGGGGWGGRGGRGPPPGGRGRRCSAGRGARRAAPRSGGSSRSSQLAIRRGSRGVCDARAQNSRPASTASDI